jgi:hypothetical protein
MLDIIAVRAAMQGCLVVYFKMSISPNYLEAAANVAVTAKGLGVTAFVNLSQMTVSHAYEFDPALFQPKIAEAGYWVARCDVAPLTVSPVGDLLARHVEAEIELRVVRNLWPIIDAIVGSELEFSIIRKANAQPRLASK